MKRTCTQPSVLIMFMFLANIMPVSFPVGTHTRARIHTRTHIHSKYVLVLIHFYYADNLLDVQVLTPLLRCLGNICCGLKDVSARACKNKDLMPALGTVLQSEHRHIKKECLWVLSNVTGKNTARVACLG